MYATSPATFAQRSIFASDLIVAPAVTTHFDTDTWHKGDIALTLTCLGNGERSSKRSVGKFCSAYHQNSRSMIWLFCCSSRFPL